MTITIPSTTVKSRFLKTLHVGMVFQDPRNKYSYIIKEKKVNDTLTKIGKAYFGNDDPALIVVPDNYMKIDNPKQANIMSVMKEKLIRLEQSNAELMAKLNIKCKNTFKSKN